MTNIQLSTEFLGLVTPFINLSNISKISGICTLTMCLEVLGKRVIGDENSVTGIRGLQSGETSKENYSELLLTPKISEGGNTVLGSAGNRDCLSDGPGFSPDVGEDMDGG